MPQSIIKHSIKAQLAHALSMLASCRDALLQIYNANRAAYFAAAAASPDRRAPVLTFGNAQAQVMSMRTLGILQAGDDVSVRRLLRSADKKTYDALMAARSDASIILENYVRIPDGVGADECLLLLIVAMGTCSVLGINIAYSPIISEIIAKFDRDATRASQSRKTRDRQAEKHLVSMFGCSSFTGYDHLFDAAGDDGRKALEGIALAFDAEGIDIGDYCFGTHTDAYDVSFIDAPNRVTASVSAAMLMIARSIRKDRAFALQLYNETKLDELEDAKVQLSQAMAQRDSLQRQIDNLHAAMDAAKSEKTILENKVQQLTEQLHAHDADDQELAAMRDAVYRASDSEYHVPEAQQRTVPEGCIIIGGHPDWARRMEQQTGARAWPAGTTCPPQVVSSAAQVWIQADYMAHKQFYAAIDIARRLGKVVRYFSSTGVDRCVQDMRSV